MTILGYIIIAALIIVIILLFIHKQLNIYDYTQSLFMRNLEMREKLEEVNKLLHSRMTIGDHELFNLHRSIDNLLKRR